MASLRVDAQNVIGQAFGRFVADARQLGKLVDQFCQRFAQLAPRGRSLRFLADPPVCHRSVQFSSRRGCKFALAPSGICPNLANISSSPGRFIPAVIDFIASACNCFARPGRVDRRGKQILDQFAIRGDRRIDPAAKNFAQAVDLDGDHAGAGRSLGAAAAERSFNSCSRLPICWACLSIPARLPKPLNITNCLAFAFAAPRCMLLRLAMRILCLNRDFLPDRPAPHRPRTIRLPGGPGCSAVWAICCAEKPLAAELRSPSVETTSSSSVAPRPPPCGSLEREILRSFAGHFARIILRLKSNDQPIRRRNCYTTFAQARTAHG